jgi:death-on-curing protein
LDSALMQPESTFHYGQGDLAAIAAAYAFLIAQNQPFIDGNKRTAITSALAFLELNGISTSALTDAELYDAMIGIAEKRLDKVGLAEIFRKHLPA